MSEELQTLEDYCMKPVDDKREVLLINPHQSEFREKQGVQSEMSGGPDDAGATRKKQVRLICFQSAC